MKMILLLFLGLPCLGLAYEMVINHRNRNPWWKSSELSSNEVQRSYQYFYPFYKENKNEGFQWKYGAKKDNSKLAGWNYPSSNSIRKKNNFRWNYPTNNKKLNYPWNTRNKDYFSASVPTIPPLSPERLRAMNARQWPDSIPPIRMIKLPLDEPPARL